MNAKVNTIPFVKKNSQGIKKVIIDNKLRCSNCGYLLDISKFYKDKYSATGYRSDCSNCSNRHKIKKQIEKNTSGIIGLYFEKCAYKGCQKNFTTKTPTKVFCDPKCRKRDWYEKNEQGKGKSTHN
ncbi:hypothetical protein ACOTWR_06605 [Aliarcobacter butzleri]|uniref:hypothetical protein n=1 Tax=Aliarcobacter butzleri TaxID=28197 RepID=UPI0021B17F9A|nr:hypothetical protein [Aliarcobacter butzleri]MCT7564117.1 hypothetical protein [Aliarcobacter butzleri]MCT7578724.1 hypothetical protein [Aliarcobacter butzleri]MCT7647667.1 hypothetical protein [Aliarcobacter butzleri]